MANQDLLKQAIAEAKAIREAAISNAKDVMEETLTPHLKDLLAAKLQEMEEEEVNEYDHKFVEFCKENPNHPECPGSYYNEGEEEEMDEAQGNIDAHEENPHDQLEEEEVAEEDEPAEDDAEESQDEAEEDAEEGAEEEKEIEDMEVEDLKALIRDIIAQELQGMAPEAEVEDEIEDEEGGVDDMVAADDEEIDLNELLAELDALSEEEEKEEEKEEVNEWDHEFVEFCKENPNHPECPGSYYNEGEEKEDVNEDCGCGKSVNEEANSDLNEALETIETLRNELQEVNLLNSKLLYVNKIFKAFNLSESQKVNIITTFDKAETVKEVKLVYETVAENIGNKKEEKTIKEHKSFASKAAGNSTKGEIISEVSDQVRRMQKLAGIIK